MIKASHLIPTISSSLRSFNISDPLYRVTSEKKAVRSNPLPSFPLVSAWINLPSLLKDTTTELPSYLGVISIFLLCNLPKSSHHTSNSSISKALSRVPTRLGNLWLASTSFLPFLGAVSDLYFSPVSFSYSLTKPSNSRSDTSLFPSL